MTDRDRRDPSRNAEDGAGLIVYKEFVPLESTHQSTDIGNDCENDICK